MAAMEIPPPTPEDLARDLDSDYRYVNAYGMVMVEHAPMWAAVLRRCAAAETEVKLLRTSIRKHRDYRGDDRCHLDDGELYAVLPEGDTRPEKDTAVTIENCQRFIECRQIGREYVSPQRRIEELEVEVRSLQAQLDLQQHYLSRESG